MEMCAILTCLGICGISFNWTSILWDEDRISAYAILVLGALMLFLSIVLIGEFIWEHLLKKRRARTRDSRTI